MHPVTQALPAEQHHRNHGLFSDHYLNVTLPQRPEWGELVAQAHSIMHDVAKIFEDYVPAGKEAAAEHEVVRPVLDLLGHEQTYEIQPSLETGCALSAAGGVAGAAVDAS